jgi:hypothetical protein
VVCELAERDSSAPTVRTCSRSPPDFAAFPSARIPRSGSVKRAWSPGETSRGSNGERRCRGGRIGPFAPTTEAGRTADDGSPYVILLRGSACHPRVSCTVSHPEAQREKACGPSYARSSRESELADKFFTQLRDYIPRMRPGAQERLMEGLRALDREDA